VGFGIKKLANWKWLWISMVFILSLTVTLRFIGTDPSTTDQFVSYSQERLEMARVAARLINDHPFFGCGLNSYRFLSGYYKNPILFFKSISLEVHNTFLQVWAELGLMGLLSFLGLFGLGLRNLFHSATRQRTPYDKPLLGITIVIAVFCLLHPILYWEVLWLTLAAVIAHQSIESTPRGHGFRNLSKQEIIPKGR
jgi:O-antigen ligase